MKRFPEHYFEATSLEEALKAVKAQLQETLNDLEKGYTVEGMIKVAIKYINFQLKAKVKK